MLLPAPQVRYSLSHCMDERLFGNRLVLRECRYLHKLFSRLPR